MTRGDSLELVPLKYNEHTAHKLCKDCKWYNPEQRNVGVASHPVMMNEHNCINPYVTKEHTDVILGVTYDRVSCQLARYGGIGVHGACGIKGQFWEHK
jgi:hypothetical protein